MRVLFVQKRANRAGAQVCLLETVVALRHAGIDARVVLGKEGWLSSELEGHGSLAAVVPFPSFRSPVSRLLRMGKFSRTVIPVVDGWGPIDIVSANDTWEGLLAEWIANRLDIPWTVHLRTTLGRDHYYKYHCNRAQAVVAVSPAVYEEARSWDHALFEYIPEGIPSSLFRPGRESASAFPDHACVLGHGGAVKGWDDFVSALRIMQSRSIRTPGNITFLGQIDEARENVLRGRIPEGITAVFAGHVNDLASRIREFDIAIVPSRRESFGMVVIETLAAGVPVLASSTGIVPYIMGNGSPWTFSPEDPESLAAALGRLPSLWHCRTAALEEARSLIRREFLIETTASKLVALYRTMTRTGMAGGKV